MSLNIRTYHELTGADRSGLADQIGAQRRRVADRLASVRRVVAVLSGKGGVGKSFVTAGLARALARDRKSTRLNSSHLVISYAVFCLKKKKKNKVRLSARLDTYNAKFLRLDVIARRGW